MRTLKIGDTLHFRKTDVKDGSFTPIWTLNGQDVDYNDPVLDEEPFGFYRMLVAKGDAKHACPYKIVPPDVDLPHCDDEIDFALAPVQEGHS